MTGSLLCGLYLKTKITSKVRKNKEIPSCTAISVPFRAIPRHFGI